MYSINQRFFPYSIKLCTMTATIISFAAYNKALEDAIAAIDKIAMPIDAQDRKFFFSYQDLYIILSQTLQVDLQKFSELNCQFYIPIICGGGT